MIIQADTLLGSDQWHRWSVPPSLWEKRCVSLRQKEAVFDLTSCDSELPFLCVHTRTQKLDDIDGRFYSLSFIIIIIKNGFLLNKNAFHAGHLGPTSRLSQFPLLQD